METSSSVDWRTVQFMMPVRLSAAVIATPASPGLSRYQEDGHRVSQGFFKGMTQT